MLKNTNMLKININHFEGILIANKDKLDFNKTKSAIFSEQEIGIENNQNIRKPTKTMVGFLFVFFCVYDNILV